MKKVSFLLNKTCTEDNYIIIKCHYIDDFSKWKLRPNLKNLNHGLNLRRSSNI